MNDFKSHLNNPKVGQLVKNTNSNCKHYGSEGFIVNVNELPQDSGITACYCCTNDGKNWKSGDVLEKTLDQLSPLGLNLKESDLKVSKNLLYHSKKSIPINENLFRIGSDSWFSLIKETRELAYSGKYFPTLKESFLLFCTDLGEFGFFEGKKVPLDFPMLSEWDRSSLINENEYKGRKVKLNKPMKGDSKKYKVYVKNDKGNVIKVEFGDVKGGLTQKISDPKARSAFSKRHNCDEKDDKTKPGYWSCRLPRYWKELGFKQPSNPNAWW
jgi:hypothetical protein